MNTQKHAFNNTKHLYQIEQFYLTMKPFCNRNELKGLARASSVSSWTVFGISIS
jgi:hypothetical protein